MMLDPVTVAAIRHLDKVSGAGLVDSRRAWEKSGGDIDKALDLLRKRGIGIVIKPDERAKR